MELIDAAHRFWNRISSTSTGCWLWGGTIHGKGYGSFAAKCDAHRYAYELCVGAIPDGWEIDHKCGVRACVNPDHLQAVPDGWNGAQGFAIAAKRRREATHCRRGHEFTPENTIVQHGKYRQCRACARVYMRRAEKRYRAKKLAARSEKES